MLIGLERERRKGDGPDRRAAGIRSFALVAVSGALVQLLSEPGLVAVGGLLVASLAAISHFKSRSADPGLTTELALFFTYLVRGRLHRNNICSMNHDIDVEVVSPSKGRLRVTIDGERSSYLEGEALRDDENYKYVAAWESKGDEWQLHKEELKFENIKIAQRSYK